MTTATQPRLASLIVPSLRMSLGYAQQLVRDIPAEKFAHLPAKNINHPAWCLGHLAIYAERTLELIGRADLAAPDQRFVEAYKAGTPCVEGPSNLPKEEIVRRFETRWAVVADVLPGVPDERFFTENPMEGRMKELMPTIGAAVIFLVGPHHMMHLGQISTWRRLIGLGSAM
ncbi:MAG: DinB family protein [Phycisphaeraceae bacterium]|nr:DinB family protein [Phycisphaeraceae bacterium]